MHKPNVKQIKMECSDWGRAEPTLTCGLLLRTHLQMSSLRRGTLENMCILPGRAKPLPPKDNFVAVNSSDESLINISIQTGRPGMLWFMGSQRVRHDWVTELNWTELNWTNTRKNKASLGNKMPELGTSYPLHICFTHGCLYWVVYNSHKTVGPREGMWSHEL